MSNTPMATFALLNGVPTVDAKENLRIALNSGRRSTAILREMLTLRLMAGKLSPAEYLYYQLWDPRLSIEQKRAFVGKRA